MNAIIITQINTVYRIQMHSGDIYCLNRNSLIWNLENVFNLKDQDGFNVMKSLDENGQVKVYAEAV